MLTLIAILTSGTVSLILNLNGLSQSKATLRSALMMTGDIAIMRAGDAQRDLSSHRENIAQTVVITIMALFLRLAVLTLIGI